MAVRTETIREIQVGLSARNPVPVEQATITAANGIPSSNTDGVSVLGANGLPTVYTFISVEKGASVTSYDIRWWGYHDPRSAWVLLSGSTSTGLEQSYGEFIPTGPVTRVYCEVTAITDSGSDGVTPVIAPCDSAAA